jgi:hypothetical protein
MLMKKIGGLFVALSLTFSLAEAAEFPEFIEDTPANRAAYERAVNHLKENASAYKELVGSSEYYGGLDKHDGNLVSGLLDLKFTGYAGKKEWGVHSQNPLYYQDVWCNDSNLSVRVKRYTCKVDSHEGQFTIGLVTQNPNHEYDWKIKRNTLTNENNEIAKIVVEEKGDISLIPPRFEGNDPSNVCKIYSLKEPEDREDLDGWEIVKPKEQKRKPYKMKTAHKNLVRAESPDSTVMDKFEIR